MLCSREVALQLMRSGKDPREVLVAAENESAEEKMCREELILAIMNKDQTFFHYAHYNSEIQRLRGILESLGYKVLSGGSCTGNAVLYDRREEPNY